MTIAIWLRGPPRQSGVGVPVIESRLNQNCLSRQSSILQPSPPSSACHSLRLRRLQPLKSQVDQQISPVVLIR